MNTFFKQTINQENTAIFHLFTGAVLGNFKELEDKLEQGWSIYTYFPDTLIGTVLPNSSTENRNQPVSSFTLILTKNPEIQQKLIIFRKLGINEIDYSIKTQKELFSNMNKNDRIDEEENKFFNLLSQNFSLVGNMSNENSNQQQGWLSSFVQILIMQKNNNPEPKNLTIVND